MNPYNTENRKLCNWLLSNKMVCLLSGEECYFIYGREECNSQTLDKSKIIGDDRFSITQEEAYNDLGVKPEDTVIDWFMSYKELKETDDPSATIDKGKDIVRDKFKEAKCCFGRLIMRHNVMIAGELGVYIIAKGWPIPEKLQEEQEIEEKDRIKQTYEAKEICEKNLNNLHKIWERTYEEMEKEQNEKDNIHTRKWTSNGGKSVLLHPKACVFCDHCTDIFWDYRNGPYMINCELELNSTEGYHGKCGSFKEENK